MAYDKKYSDEECAEMIRSGQYPVDAPSFVIIAIRNKRRNFDRSVKSPKKEMEDFMKELNAQKPARREDGF